MEKHKKFTKEERASWPEGHKRCRTCWEVLPLSDFHNHSSGLMGKYHTCKPCRKPESKAGWQARTFEQTLLASSRFRAKNHGIPHTITIQDIVIPEVCPILGVEIVLERGHPYGPSLDQINPRAGYTPENIQVTSLRGNLLKNNMTAEEALLVYKYLAGNCEVVDIRS